MNKPVSGLELLVTIFVAVWLGTCCGAFTWFVYQAIATVRR